VRDEEILGAGRRILAFRLKPIKLQSAQEAVWRKLVGRDGKIMENVSWFVRPIEEARVTPEEVAAANATRSSTPIVALPGEPRTATGGGSSGSPVEQVPTLESPAREPMPTSVTEQRMNFVAPASSVMVYRQLPNKLMSALPLEANTSNFELGLGGFGKVKFGCM
jgi:hypothetical protein